MQSMKLYSRHWTLLVNCCLILISGKSLKKAEQYQIWLSIDCNSCSAFLEMQKNIFLV